ncbi:MAG: sugar phosphate isomerase/epimerase [Fimbriiglobus sp.]|jgi:sugar phosphate isomerase/epimerase|nr:sugar phosphate isomerase/epimerase [Fimbriiglobus sp.]
MTTLSRRSFLAASVAAPFVLPTIARAAEPKTDAKFKLGLVTYNVAKDWDLPTLLKHCKAAGVAAVECRTTHKHGVEPTLSAEQRKDVKKQFADSGVVFWGCGSVCEFHSEDPAVVRKNVEECKRFCDLVKDLGGKGVKVRPNGVGKGMTVEQAVAQIGKALTECGKAAESAGVEIWVEVHGPKESTAQPKTMRAIMDACGHKAVGVTWNSNASDLIGGKLDEGFDLLQGFLKSCHINDLTNDKKGTYPYRDLFAKLKGIGYDRYTLCEVGTPVKPDDGGKWLADYHTQWKELVG